MREMSELNLTVQGGPELPTGSAMVSEPPGLEVMGTTSGTGVLKSPEPTDQEKMDFFEELASQDDIEEDEEEDEEENDVGLYTKRKG